MVSFRYRMAATVPIVCLACPRVPTCRGDFDPARDRYLESTPSRSRPLSPSATLLPSWATSATFALFNEDFSILKDFALYEAHRIQFRAEFFNIFNRVVFGAPSANLNAPATFGRIGGQANRPVTFNSR